MKLEHELEIARPPEDVYAFLADPENLPRWQSGVSEVASRSESRFVEVRSFLGREARSEVEVTAADAPREFSVRVLSGPLRASVRHLLAAAAGGGTRLRVEIDVPGVPRLAKLPARRQLQADFDRLRRLLEG